MPGVFSSPHAEPWPFAETRGSLDPRFAILLPEQVAQEQDLTILKLSGAV